MKLHMRQFDGITFGMTAESSSQSTRNFKKRIFYKEMQPKDHIRKRYPCIRANDLIPLMGMETVQFDDDPREIYIIYEKEEKQ